MGCSGSRLSLFSKPIKWEPPLPPNVNPVTIEEQPDSPWVTRSKSTSELASVRKTGNNSVRRVQSFAHYDKSGWAGRSAENSTMDQKKINRLLERQRSERQALEAFKADAALNDTIMLPELREITEINDNLTRPGNDALSMPGFIDQYTGQAQGYKMQPFSQHMTEKVGAVPPYLIEKGRYGQEGYVQPMILNKNRYEAGALMNNKYQTGYTMPNRNEPFGIMQTLGNTPMVAIHQAYYPRNGHTVNRSLSYISRASSGRIVMGQKPEVEDRFPNHHMINNQENPMLSTQFNTAILLSGHKDDPFWTSENGKKMKANPGPSEISSRQASNKVGADSPVHWYQMPNKGPGINNMAHKSNESKASKYGENSSELDSRNSPPGTFSDLDPNMDNDPLQLGLRMSDMLEGVLSVDTSSSTTQEMESGAKTKGVEEENWEEIVRETNTCVSSSSSSELGENVYTSKIDPIYKSNWQSGEQPAGF